MRLLPAVSAVLLGACAPAAIAARPAPLTVLPLDVANPAMPCVPPVADAHNPKNKYMAVPAKFTYPLAPFVSFPQGGQLTASLKNGPQRQAQTLIALQDPDYTLNVQTTPASENRLLVLRVTSRKRNAITSEAKLPLPPVWTQVTLKWTGKDASLTCLGQEATAVLPEGIKAGKVALSADRVDDLEISGSGSLRLDWERGYAATVKPAEDSRDIVVRPQGFDAYYISDKPGRRDTPGIAVSNGSAAAVKLPVSFSLKSEISGRSEAWTQTVTAPAISTANEAIKWAKPLTSDIYHLHIECKEAVPPFSSDVHFVYAQRRTDAAGPVKFGLHDSDRSVPGFWPDALPIKLAHHYARWGYIVGPAWIKDNHGEYGLDPATPAENWNWNDDLDWSIAQGLTPYVCLSGEPMQPWMRDRETDAWRMVKHPWGTIGGHANEKYCREWVRATVSRYKGKVGFYEIQNEPNSHPPGGYSPEDYVELLKAAYEEIHATDPKAKVFGICGTGDFVPWMTKVFNLGGYKYMDGVSIHTYTTPRLPDPAGLPAKLDQVRDLIAKHKPSLLLLNSETGTYVAPREEVSAPIATDRLADLVSKGAPTLSVPYGWPNYALDENTGATSIVRNAVFNFAAGAQNFVFFGWNSEWPRADWSTKQADAWGIITVDKNGVRTPGRYALAVGVCAAQLESALLNPVPLTGNPGVHGAVFRTVSGGSTAVVWSTSGTRTAVFNIQGQGAEAVSLLGQPVELKASQATPGALRVDLTEQPLYLQLKKGTLSLQPAPVGDVVIARAPNNRYEMSFPLTNQTKATWKNAVSYQGPPGWRVEAPDTSFDLPAGGTKTMSFIVNAPASANGQISVAAKVPTPDGDSYTASFPLKVRPSLSIVRQESAGTLTYDGLNGPAIGMNRPEQVAVGRPPALASLQEEKYWKGPSELSANVKTAYSSEGIWVGVRVHDANYRPSATWPGVLGSTVELFFDFRDAATLGTPAYGKGVYQFVLKPPASEGEAVQIWAPKSGDVPGVQAKAERNGEQDYTVNFFLPWKSAGVTPSAGTQIGFDVALDAPPPGGGSRKTQMVLFGTANNSNDASEFGHAVLSKAE